MPYQRLAKGTNIHMRKDEMAQEALKAAPPLTVTGATLLGVPVSDLVMWATLIYLGLQIGFLLYKWWRIHYSPAPLTIESED